MALDLQGLWHEHPGGSHCGCAPPHSEALSSELHRRRLKGRLYRTSPLEEPLANPSLQPSRGPMTVAPPPSPLSVALEEEEPLSLWWKCVQQTRNRRDSIPQGCQKGHEEVSVWNFLEINTQNPVV